MNNVILQILMIYEVQGYQGKNRDNLFTPLHLLIFKTQKRYCNAPQPKVRPDGGSHYAPKNLVLPD
jgi:hypothetical protein